MHNHHYLLTSKQVQIWEHLKKCLEIAKNLRAGNRLILMLLGDAIDGDHHGTFELVTRNIGEQKDTHIQLMQYVKDELDYQAGDELLYLSGTNVHVGDEENGLAAQLGAYQYSDGFYSTAFLELELNGVLFWFYHEGVKAGNRPNRGNGAVNAMKRVHYDCKVEGKRLPDYIVTGHTHDADHFTYTQDNHTMHYIILASWQDKTRFVKDKMALSSNRVGMQVIHISKDGIVKVDAPILQESPRGETVVL